jgi:hypothetical protein
MSMAYGDGTSIKGVEAVDWACINSD